MAGRVSCERSINFQFSSVQFSLSLSLSLASYAELNLLDRLVSTKKKEKKKNNKKKTNLGPKNTIFFFFFFFSFVDIRTDNT